MLKPVCLTLKAGAGALKSIQNHGFDPASVGSIIGASGGAKWLVLSQLDRAILRTVVPRLREPVHLLGSSIGAWRFSCYAQRDPVAAIERFEDAYIEQRFSEHPDIDEITAMSHRIIRIIMRDGAEQEILSNPLFRLHVMAVRSRHILASENRWLLGLGLLTAAGLNVIDRRTLGLFFERALFFDQRDLPPFYDATGFPLQQVPLDSDNLADAVLATGAIPLVLRGVADIEGAMPGVYRDGGIIDYHHDIQHSEEDRLALYPHFLDRMVPGWFDKRLGWRRPSAAHTDQTLLISPSAEFVSRLPNGKIPDRSDFVTLSEADRIAAWRECVVACEQLADEFSELVATEQLAAHVQAL